MPTRRLVVALAVLLVGTFGLGVVTAVRRAGDGGAPLAGGTPSPSASPFETESPVPSPSPAVSESPQPVAEPTPGTGSDGSEGPGEGPHLPRTGGEQGWPLTGLALGLTGWAVARRRATA